MSTGPCDSLMRSHKKLEKLYDNLLLVMVLSIQEEATLDGLVPFLFKHRLREP